MPRGVYDRKKPDVPHDKPTIRYDAILGVRFLRAKDRFAGMWELVKLDEGMNRIKVVTDANSKGAVIVLASREIQRIVAVKQ